MCGDKCTDPTCIYLKSPDHICRSMAKHGHCRFHFFGLLNKVSPGLPYPWAGDGCRRLHCVPHRVRNDKGEDTGRVNWYVLKDDHLRLECADKKCATQQAWVKYYDDEHKKDVEAKKRSEAARDQRAVVETLQDSVKVQARVALQEKVKARRDGTAYDPVEHAKGIAQHLDLARLTKAEGKEKPRQYNLFSKKK